MRLSCVSHVSGLPDIDDNLRRQELLTRNKQETFEINACFLAEGLEDYFWANLVVLNLLICLLGR